MKRLLFIFLALCCVISTAIAQEKMKYSGVVKDEQGQPLIGVSIVNTKNNTGTTTNLNGEFEISTEKGGSLQFSYLGLTTQMIKLGAATKIAVVMESDNTEIEEVVVTGYGTQRRSDISTAVSSVDMDAVEKSGASQVLEAMQGQISGVEILSDDGSPAGNVTFRIRGTSSLTAGTQPLFVIDGVPQPIETEVEYDADGNEVGNNPLAGINPDDIESMEVLKDAAAAAIYGAEGSNGVVIITTKSGQAGKPQIRVSARLGLNMIPSNKMEVMSMEEYAIRRAAGGNAAWEEIVERKDWNDPRRYTDWVDEVTRTAKRKEISVSMSGGNEEQTYMLSVGYQQNESLVIEHLYQRFSMRLNLTQKFGKKATLTGNFSYSNTTEENPTGVGVYRKAYLADPFMLYRGMTDEELEEEDAADEYNFKNPVVNIKNQDVNKYDQRLSANLRFNYKITDDLTFITSLASGRSLKDDHSVMGTMTSAGRNCGGKLILENGTGSNWNFMTQLQYNKAFNNNHRITAFAAFESKYHRSENYGQTATNFNGLLNLGQYSLVNAGKFATPKFNTSESSTLSQLGRVTYDYKHRYVINASLRRDGTSKFSDDNKYAIFPAISFAWRVDQESFMKSINFIKSMKFRASYGVTGNSQVGSYTSLALLNMDNVAFGGGKQEISANQSSLANADLKWETSREFNTGLDVSFLKNRIDFSVDAYYKIVSDMLLQTALPTSSGFSTGWKNAGKMSNMGLEFTVNARPVVKKDFSWKTNFNIAFNRNKVLELNDGQYEQFYGQGGFGNNVLLRVGMSSGIYYGYIEDGVYNTQEEINNTPDATTKKLGYRRFIDVNGDGIVDTNDRVPIANVIPIHTGGWGNTFSYKNLDLNIQMRWSYGADQINCNLKSMGNPASSSTNCLRDAYFNAWTAEEPYNNYRNRGVTNDPYSSYMSSAYVETGSYLKLSSIRLSYRLPKHIVGKLGLSSVRCSATAGNLFTITKYSGLNVEAGNGSGEAKKIARSLDNSSCPPSRSLLFSLDVSL